MEDTLLKTDKDYRDYQWFVNEIKSDQSYTDLHQSSDQHSSSLETLPTPLHYDKNSQLVQTMNFLGSNSKEIQRKLKAHRLLSHV